MSCSARPPSDRPHTGAPPQVRRFACGGSPEQIDPLRGSHPGPSPSSSGLGPPASARITLGGWPASTGFFPRELRSMQRPVGKMSPRAPCRIFRLEDKSSSPMVQCPSRPRLHHRNPVTREYHTKYACHMAQAQAQGKVEDTLESRGKVSHGRGLLRLPASHSMRAWLRSDGAVC